MSKVDYSKIPDREKAARLMEEAAARAARELEYQTLHDSLALNYRYFRFPVHSRKGNCIRTWWVSVNFGWRVVDSHIEYSVALQSYKDFFSRPKARKVIDERFQMGFTRLLPVFFDSSKDIGSLLAWHYNNLDKKKRNEIFGIEEEIPSYLSKIPL